jgi:hypothetical protein
MFGLSIGEKLASAQDGRRSDAADAMIEWRHEMNSMRRLALFKSRKRRFWASSFIGRRRSLPVIPIIEVKTPLACLYFRKDIAATMRRLTIASR